MTQSAPKTAPANPLDSMTTLLREDMARVNAIILEKMQSDVPLIPELAGHLIAAGGKRIRPLLTLATAALHNCDNGRQHRLAACVEFIHTATLLHDDVVDASDQRRGRASANAIFGNEASVLVGDFLFSRSFQLMVEDGSLEVLKILSDASAVIAEGEVLQLSIANNLEATEKDYFDVIGAKTAALFAAACEVGAVVAGKDGSAMRAYGTALGVAFQIADDILDYAADARLGKDLGDDFKEGKITLPILFALRDASAEEKKFWQRCIGDLDQKEGDFAHAVALLKKHNAFERSYAEARRICAEGKAALNGLPDHPLKRDLAALIDFAVERAY